MRNSTTRRMVITLVACAAIFSAASFCAAQATPADDRAPAVTPVGPKVSPVVNAPAVQPVVETQPASQPTSAPAAKSPGIPWQMIGLVAAMFVLFFWMGRPKRKEEKRRKEMLSNIKKGDKIVTIGGIVGTIIEAREDEVIVKVDESSNTRMRFARWAIRQVGEVKADEEKK